MAVGGGPGTCRRPSWSAAADRATATEQEGSVRAPPHSNVSRAPRHPPQPRGSGRRPARTAKGTTARCHILGPEHRHHHSALRLLAVVGYGHHPASVPGCAQKPVRGGRAPRGGQAQAGVHPCTGDHPDPRSSPGHGDGPPAGSQDRVGRVRGLRDHRGGPGQGARSLPRHGHARSSRQCRHRRPPDHPRSSIQPVGRAGHRRSHLPDHVVGAAADLHRLGGARARVAAGTSPFSTTSATTG